LRFNGTSDEVNMGDVGDMGPNDSFTLEAWIKWPVSPGGDGYSRIVAKESSGAFGYCLALDRVGAYGKAYLLVSSRYIYTTTLLNDNQWHHLVGVADAGDDSLKIYLDGEREEGTYNSGSWTGADNGGDLMIGSNYANRYFQGTIDEVAIYNRALTKDEVRTHYEMGRP